MWVMVDVLRTALTTQRTIYSDTAGAANLDADGVTLRHSDPAPDHVGIEAVIQRDPGNGCTGFLALGNNLGFEFAGKSVTALVGFGYV